MASPDWFGKKACRTGTESWAYSRGDATTRSRKGIDDIPSRMGGGQKVGFISRRRNGHAYLMTDRKIVRRCGKGIIKSVGDCQFLGTLHLGWVPTLDRALFLFYTPTVCCNPSKGLIIGKEGAPWKA